jgi:hypothetical protein
VTAAPLHVTARQRPRPIEVVIYAVFVMAPFAALAWKHLHHQSPWLLTALSALLGWGLAVAMLRWWRQPEVLTLTPEHLTWQRGPDRIESARSDVVRIGPVTKGGGLLLVVRDHDEESGTPELDYLIFTRAREAERARVLAVLGAWLRDGTLAVPAEARSGAG